MTYLSLAWQVPALFTAVPMVARLLPFKLPERAIPLLYVVVALIVFSLPAEVCLAFGAAGLVSLVHARLGESVAAIPAPDMPEVVNKLAVAWDRLVQGYGYLLAVVPLGDKHATIIHDSPDDDDPGHDQGKYPEPPRPPESRPVSRIPSL